MRSPVIVMVLILSWFVLLGAPAQEPGSRTAPETASRPTAPEGPFEPAPLENSITSMDRVEELTESAANRLIEFSDALRKRDFGKARGFLTTGFLGSPVHDLPLEREEALPLGTTRRHYRPASGDRTSVNMLGFLASLEKLLAPLSAIDHVFLKTRGAEFATDGQRGLTRFTFQVIGSRAGGRPISIYAWAHGEVRLVKGSWFLHRLVLERLQVTERDAVIFTDIAVSAGVSYRLPRLAEQGGSFFWQGAAVADIDGDGRDDIFTSTPKRNFLYRNQGDGTFADITEAAGLARPTGVTSPLFFDYDNDGDMDLFCGHAGWEKDGVPFGQSLRLFRNDGEGRFEDVSMRMGLGQLRIYAFGVAAADFDNDGWLDLYVSNYHHYGEFYPDSWYQASNGLPNLLLHNDGGQGFVDVAAQAGVAGHGWSYAASFADYDADGDQDLYVANDYGDNNLYRNRGDGTFEDVASELGVLDTGNGMGVLWSDLDGDGALDIYISNMASSAGQRILRRFAEKAGSHIEGKLYKLAAGNTIFLQRDGRFERLPASAGGIGASWAWGASALDIDLDGHPDVYVASGFISGDSLKDT